MDTLCLANIRCIFSVNDRTYGTVTTPLDFSCVLSGNLDLLAPYEQDWIDYPQQERERIERAILHPNEFCKTCWYWLDLLIIGIDEVDRF